MNTWNVAGPILLVLCIVLIIVMCEVVKNNGTHRKVFVNGKQRHAWIRNGIIYVADDKKYSHYFKNGKIVSGSIINEVHPGF